MPSQIPAAGRTLAVFEVFAREQRELSHSELARLLSLPESSCSDLLHTLHTLGYLMRTPRTRRFYPTARLQEVSREITVNDPLTALAQEAVEQLSDRTNESAYFGLLDRHAARIAAAQPTRLALRYILNVGDRVALNASAMGKALLGALPAEGLHRELEQMKLRAITPGTLTHTDQLVRQLETSRSADRYETHGEGIEGVSGLAVSGWLGEQPVALSLAGPSERMARHHDFYLQALRDVRNALLISNHPTP